MKNLPNEPFWGLEKESQQLFERLIIFLLLYLNFRNITEPLVVMISIPFGLVGGIWLIFMNGYKMSVAVAVGFIALTGMAAEIGVLVLSFIDTEIRARRSDTKIKLS